MLKWNQRVVRRAGNLLRFPGIALAAINSPGIYQEVIVDRLQKNLRAFGSREKRPNELKISCGITWFDPEAPRSAEDLLALSCQEGPCPTARSLFY